MSKNKMAVLQEETREKYKDLDDSMLLAIHRTQGHPYATLARYELTYRLEDQAAHIMELERVVNAAIPLVERLEVDIGPEEDDPQVSEYLFAHHALSKRNKEW